MFIMGLGSYYNETGEVKESFYFSLILVQITIVDYRIERVANTSKGF